MLNYRVGVGKINKKWCNWDVRLERREEREGKNIREGSLGI